ncbi:MAG: 30S ribosomal protein S20 [bacterium]|nr:30S ribosomal protein S20 [bacterium]
MPVIKSAKKKLRQDKKRTQRNAKKESLFENLIKKAKKNPSPQAIKKAFSAIDKAKKSKIIHANKAARLKSSLSKLETGKTVKSKAPKKKK